MFLTTWSRIYKIKRAFPVSKIYQNSSLITPSKIKNKYQNKHLNNIIKSEKCWPWNFFHKTKIFITTKTGLNHRIPLYYLRHLYKDDFQTFLKSCIFLAWCNFCIFVAVKLSITAIFISFRFCFFSNYFFNDASQIFIIIFWFPNLICIFYLFIKIHQYLHIFHQEFHAGKGNYALNIALSFQRVYLLCLFS